LIGLVIVSHSYYLAQGVKELADQMAGGEINIVAAGGLQDNDDYHLGTDAQRIAQAVQEAWNEDGVLLLMDMGSAVLSAEMALEILPAEMRQRCLLSNAPLVEGAIVAALQASLGHNLEKVNEAAEMAHTLQKVAQ
jgi:dihydroxyacetone kinase phosphotransfer subunit